MSVEVLLELGRDSSKPLRISCEEKAPVSSQAPRRREGTRDERGALTGLRLLEESGQLLLIHIQGDKLVIYGYHANRKRREEFAYTLALLL